ncbi:DUF2690 domain-containing protein [Streptomyces sp. NPDC050617]|uniref:helix-turn-helix domain-containing protein n=1 Tax=Streptomyces sp. NPDC050617 TaxID=3154628 RepID=UPI00343A48D1
MPRWKALPEELDPQLREFANQLRRLVERSGLSLSALADRTGYSKTSWERYLNGRLLPPRGAAEALAEATGTSAVHLGTMWELAERAWSRSEMRHDVTMEAMRVAQARAALGEFGPPPPKSAKNGGSGKRQESPPPPRPQPPAPPSGPAGRSDPTAGSGPTGPTSPSGPTGQSGPTGYSGHSGYTPRSGTPRPGYSDDASSPPGPRSGPPPGSPSGPPSGPSSGLGRSSGPPPDGPRGSGPPPASASTPASATPAAATDAQRRRRRVSMFLAGLVGTLLVIAAAVLLVGVGGDSGDGTKSAESAGSPSATSKPKLPAGVKCVGQDCTGKDPEAMGCGGASATSPAAATIGSAYVEVRYSKVCGAYWARITQAAPGDAVQVAAAGTAGAARTENGKVDRDADAYTPMVAASAPLRITACATLATGEKGCTPATAAPPSPAGSPVG